MSLHDEQVLNHVPGENCNIGLEGELIDTSECDSTCGHVDTVQNEVMNSIYEYPLTPSVMKMPVAQQLGSVNLEEDNVIFLAQTGSGKTMVVAAAEVKWRKARGEDVQIWMRQPTKQTVGNVMRGLKHFWPDLTIGVSTRDRKENLDTADIVVYSDGSLFKVLNGGKKIIAYFDEVHWMSNINTELEMALCKAKGIKMRLLSATIDPQPLVNYLGGASVHELTGRMFPIKKHTRTYNPRSDDDQPDSFRNCLGRELFGIKGKARRGIVFLRTKAECEEAADYWGKRLDVPTTFVHGEVDPQDVIDFEDRHKDGCFFMFCTTAASTGLTIDVHDVIIHDEVMDSDMKGGIERQFSRIIDNNMLLQMAGRAGRLREGNAVLISPEGARNYWSWNVCKPEPIIGPCSKTTPFNVILAMAASGIKSDDDIDLFSPIDGEEMSFARQWLVKTGCVAGDGSITGLGRNINRMTAPAPSAHLVATAPGNDAKLAMAAAYSLLQQGSYFLTQVKPGTKVLEKIRDSDPGFQLLPREVVERLSMPVTMAKLLQRAARARSRENTSETLRSWCDESNVALKAMNVGLYNFEQLAETFFFVENGGDARRKLMDLKWTPELVRSINEHVKGHITMTTIDFHSSWGNYYDKDGTRYGAVNDSLALDIFDLDPDVSTITSAGVPKVIRSRKTGTEFVSLEFLIVKEWNPRFDPYEALAGEA